MKPVMSIVALFLGLGIAQSNANVLGIHARNPDVPFAATYPAMQAFHRVVGGKSFIGYFQSEPSACSVWILSKPANEPPSEKPSQQQVAVNLGASQTMTFIVDSRGSRLTLQCAADAKSLKVSQSRNYR